MEMTGDPVTDPALALLVRWLRAIPDWDKNTMAEKSQLDPSTVWRYERGLSRPSRETLDRMAAAVGLSWTFLDGCLLPAARAVVAVRKAHAAPGPEDRLNLDDFAAELSAGIEDIVRTAVGSFRFEEEAKR